MLLKEAKKKNSGKVKCGQEQTTDVEDIAHNKNTTLRVNTVVYTEVTEKKRKVNQKVKILQYLNITF